MSDLKTLAADAEFFVRLPDGEPTPWRVGLSSVVGDLVKAALVAEETGYQAGYAKGLEDAAREFSARETEYEKLRKELEAIRLSTGKPT